MKYKLKICTICTDGFIPRVGNQNVCSQQCKRIKRIQQQKSYYKNHAKEIYHKYKSYHIKYNAGRLRAERLFKKLKVPKICSNCNIESGRIDIHHKDTNVNNNDISNLELLCRSCHQLCHVKLRKRLPGN